jgi:hypothetical protein
LINDLADRIPDIRLGGAAAWLHVLVWLLGGCDE